MPLPSSYASEIEFAQWMHGVLGQDAHVSGYFEWAKPEEDTGEYKDAVNEALAVYGQSNITAVDNIHLLHKIGRVELWRMVSERAVAEYDETGRDAATVRNLSQIYDHALKMMVLAEKRVPSGYYTSGRKPFGSQSVQNVARYG